MNYELVVLNTEDRVILCLFFVKNNILILQDNVVAGICHVLVSLKFFSLLAAIVSELGILVLLFVLLSFQRRPSP